MKKILPTCYALLLLILPVANASGADSTKGITLDRNFKLENLYSVIRGASDPYYALLRGDKQDLQEALAVGGLWNKLILLAAIDTSIQERSKHLSIIESTLDNFEWRKSRRQFGPAERQITAGYSSLFRSSAAARDIRKDDLAFIFDKKYPDSACILPGRLCVTRDFFDAQESAIRKEEARQNERVAGIRERIRLLQ